MFQTQPKYLDMEDDDFDTKPPPSRTKLITPTLIIVMTSLIIVLLLLTGIGLTIYFTIISKREIRNVIMMIPDGYGPAAVTMARLTRKNRTLELDKYPVGHVKTYSYDYWVTDSAAAATAYACGEKTYNGAIGVDKDGKPLGTVLEAAQEKGYKTGLVVTSTITHATPGSFSAHVLSRNDEEGIAAQQISKKIDILLGGGRRFYLPPDLGGVRKDGRNLMKEAETNGYTVVNNAAEFRDEKNRKLPLLGLFADSHMSFDVDRDDSKEPSLAEMSKTALDLLWKAVQDDPSSPGFFIMIEGSRIDHGCHANDAIAAARDAHAYDDAFKVAAEFAKEHPGTFVISVADHETGGLTLGRPVERSNFSECDWNFDPIMRATASVVTVSELICNDTSRMRSIIEEKLKVTDLDSREENMMKDICAQKPETVYLQLGKVIADRALINFVHTKHTGVDVNLYAIVPPGVDFKGTKENSEVGRAIEKYLGLDLDAMTKKLRGE